VLVATLTADDLLPNAAPLVADGHGARGAFACDLGAACTGFLSGLALAAAQIESGRARNALVIGADLLSRVTDRSDRKTAGLFGDGAGAVVVGGGGEGAIERILLRSDARQADCIVAGNEERLVRMRGQDTFRAAVDCLSEVTDEVLAAEGLDSGDVDLFVYHQANARIIRAVGERLDLPPERVVDCIERLGNTSAATLPLALDHAAAAGSLRPGDRVLLAAFGAGFVWGAGLMTWNAGVAS
jgi:3-oxoacyl-[acyl-carrier-protein] synthase-3